MCASKTATRKAKKYVLPAGGYRRIFSFVSYENNGKTAGKEQRPQRDVFFQERRKKIKGLRSESWPNSSFGPRYAPMSPPLSSEPAMRNALYPEESYKKLFRWLNFPAFESQHIVSTLARSFI